MGGFGSGQRGGKDCTDDMRSVDVRQLQREGLLVHGQSRRWRWMRRGQEVASIILAVERDYVRFNYRHRCGSGQWQDVHTAAYLERTPCRLGGSRVWWLCPCCGQRVALLYIGKMPACRKCSHLAYRSERETVDARATRQVGKLRDRLRWEPGFLNGNGPKPTGMHWRTFERLQARHDAYMSVSLAEFGKMLGSVQHTLEELQSRIGRY